MAKLLQQRKILPKTSAEQELEQCLIYPITVKAKSGRCCKETDQSHFVEKLCSKPTCKFKTVQEKNLINIKLAKQVLHEFKIMSYYATQVIPTC